MKKITLNRSELSLKLTAIIVTAMIAISSVAIIKVGIQVRTEFKSEHESIYQSYQTRLCEVETNYSQAIPWVHFDSTDPGTPAEAQVTVSDTTGITVVADFHGFWRSTYTNGTSAYDEVNMPGTSSNHEPGEPMIPILTEFVEIPHDIDVSIEVLATSSDTTSDYNIRPVSPLYFPVPVAEDSHPNATYASLMQSDFEGSVYYDDTFFPGVRATHTGGVGTSPLIIRDHRMVQLSFCPVQYNPVTRDVIVFSQMVVRIDYSEPAQIEPVRESLRSDVFERILQNSLIHYDPCHFKHFPLEGFSTSINRESPPLLSMPNATFPQFHLSSIPEGYVQGAEYLIITTDSFRSQAQRLADWKERKGTPSAVVTIGDDISSEEKIANVKGLIEFAYNHWYPAPTYVLLFGDVEQIPTNYDFPHTGGNANGLYFPERGDFASDLGYFTVQGNSFFPDLIYSRISVDTQEQAEIVVNRTLMYEQSPTTEDVFYTNLLTAGYFEDKNERDGTEDKGKRFLYHLENIRQYLMNQYSVHFNYSGAVDKMAPLYFSYPLKYGTKSNVVSDYLSDYEWLLPYDRLAFRDEANDAIISNINEGRFLVLYNGHGGSKNMIYQWELPMSDDNRDYTEGWHTPCFNTSYFSYLNNGDKTPLILSMACNTGWFDGETDQESCILTEYSGQTIYGNAYAMYDEECFAESFIRLEGGGAIAVVAPSRPVPALICGKLLDGIIQNFWPGYLNSENQPIYEIGGAFFAGELYTADAYIDVFSRRNQARMMYEGFHLFGDPETQLWTKFPSEFIVSRPESIGTRNPQRFVVTVNSSTTGGPVSNAKVCIQQDPYVYQVGYTDCNGQVIFEVDPRDRTWYLNLTVTKHNYKPHLGEIDVLKSGEATVQVSPGFGLGLEYPIDILVKEFQEEDPIVVYFDTDEVGIIEGSSSLQGEVPRGPVGYVNVRAVQGSTVATDLFYRLSSHQNPDPFIYSYNDTSTWYLADNELVWDNPCITIYDGKTPVNRVNQETVYDVNVTVHNRGSGDADGTLVTLWYAPVVGGISWNEVANCTVDVPLFGYEEVQFNWKPSLPDTASLKVTISHENELPEDRINNVGTECWNIFPLCSVGESTFEVGNPSEDANYALIKITQEGDHDDVWNTSLEGYSSQSLDANESNIATLVVDPGYDIRSDEGRTFSAEIYVNDEMVGGVEFTGFCDRYVDRWLWLVIILIILLLVVVAIGYYVWKSNRVESQ